jgi:hypothetical protein
MGLNAQNGERPGWLYGTGSAQAASEAEATRLAKAEAISAVFQELGKDELFQRMFLSDWPAAVEVESKSVKGDENAGYTVELSVAVDQNAVILAEGPYTAAATGLLNRAHKLVEQAEEAIRRASAEEAELEIQSAFGRYSKGKSLLAEARIILSPLGDDSIFSDEGMNLSALSTTIDGLSATVESGLSRIERLNAEIAGEQGRRQYHRTLDNLEERLSESERVIRRHIPESPFYDRPVEKLQSIRGELQTTVEDLESIAGNLESAKATLPSDEELALKRVELASDNAKRLIEHGRRMIREVEREIAYPRLERQEDAARRSRRREAFGKGLRWAFFHKPKDYISYSRFLPLTMDHRDGRSRLAPVEWDLAAEASFDPGIWLRAALAREIDYSATTLYRRSLRQTVCVGIAGKRIFGLGLSWDWVAHGNLNVSGGADPGSTTGASATGTVTGDGETDLAELTGETAVTLYLGRPNRELRRTDILFGLTYQIPRYWGSIIVPYHLNAGLDAKMRLERFVVLEATAKTGFVPLQAADQDDAALSEEIVKAWPYQFEWRAGIGLRLPPPFAIKVFYGQIHGRPAGVSADTTNAALLRRGWTFALEYSI